jgi:two-component system cell cycle sensor histidine kinase/response regulator CckA
VSDARSPVLPQAVLDAMPGAVAQLSSTGRILGANANWLALASRSQLLPSTNVIPGTSYLEACDQAATHGDRAAAEAASAVRVVLADEDPSVSLEYRLTAPDSVRWRELVVTRLDGDGYHGAIVIHVDITARKLAAEAARRTESRYRTIVENAPIGIYQTAPDGRILAANQSLADIVGAPSPSALIGTDIALIAKRAPTDAGNVEVEWKRLDGSPIWVEMAAHVTRNQSGKTLYYEGFVYDISERKRLEAELMQAQKMESVGRLAGGIAHDFNNLLTVMIGYSELMQDSKDLPDSLRPAMSEILAAARRAAELTGRMLAFARKQRVQPRAVNVNDVVRGIEGLLRRIIGEDLGLEVQLTPDLSPVLIDPAQLEQVLMNLAVNARDAMPNGGTLTITSDLVVLSEEEARRRPGKRPGRHVRLSVIDTGVGMDPETLARVFEPFFTTKPPGKGTGLGLAMCYGIVKQAGGFIDCESTKGLGTTCTVLLPETGPMVAAEPSRPSANGEARRPAAASATILVVEDEPIVRQFVGEVLKALGHNVLVTGGPSEGLAVAATKGIEIDLLVTDVVMPQMDGVALAAQIRERQPHVRVLLMSGYQDRVVADQDALLLPKPFTAAQLRTRVEEALHATRRN